MRADTRSRPQSKSVEPLLWSLFSAGGTLAALLIPVLAFLFAIAFPLGWLVPPSHEYLLTVLRHPIARGSLFLLCTLSLFHWAHRFRYTLYDGLQIKQLDELIDLFCYGAAIAGSILTAWLLWQLPQAPR
jgi:fumarate reductase subunit D